MSAEPHIVIRILSQPRYLAVVRAAVEAAAAKLGLSDDENARVTLAVDEAMSNIIRHGYHGRPDQPIWLRIAPVHEDGRSGVELTIEDECRGVDLRKIQGRPLDEVRPGGLGVHIIKGVMDEAQYDRRPGGEGVRLRMVKYARPAENRAAAKG